MSPSVHIPIDFEGRPEFRRLVPDLGAAQALAVFTRLFVELAQLARATRRVGFLPDEAVEQFLTTVAWLLPAGSLLPLLSSGSLSLLRREEGGYFCPSFAELNGHLSPDFQPMHMKGAVAKSIGGVRKQAEVVARQQTLLIDPKILVREDGTLFDAKESNKVTMLIHMVDRNLGRRQRTTSEFTAGLIGDAYRVLKTHSDDEVNRKCAWIVHHRKTDHPAVPKTTEQVLASWDSFGEG